MPEHVHLLIWPALDGPPLKDSVALIKSRTAQTVLEEWRNQHAPILARLHSSDGKLRFWQRGGGYDRNLWSPSHIWEAIDYIHANPVERGLAERADAWNWSSASAFAQRGGGPVEIDFDSMPRRP